MSGRALARRLPDGRRLHLQHGPIDIVAQADGPRHEVVLAYQQAQSRFTSILDELVSELHVLREPVWRFPPRVEGPVARRMTAAVWPHRRTFVTPMAAVAGAVADEVLDAMVRDRSLRRAYVNNGGDIAFHLAAGERLRLGLVARLDAPAIDRSLTLVADEPARGLATSGWQGRSFSLGIADAVTVLADTAAAADAAATLIANAVDCVHPAIRRMPASHLREDTDLGDLPVTVEVGALPPSLVVAALERGLERAREMHQEGLIRAARLELQGRSRALGLDPETNSFKAAR